VEASHPVENDSDRFCQYCGARLKAGANFCNACGNPVREYQAAPGPTTSVQPQPIVTSTVKSLFDPHRRYYTVKREWWTWGSGEIYDERGMVIGHMNRRVFSIREAIEFREADNRTTSALIHRKLMAIRDTFEIKDSREQLLARVKQKIFAPIHPVMWLEDPAERKILEAQGNFLGFSFRVHDMTGVPVADIDKTDKWKDIFVGGSVLDYSQHYSIVINSDIDRRLIVPLAIAIDEAIHEERKRH
jgi:uncharacterized protein YxjI